MGPLRSDRPPRSLSCDEHRARCSKPRVGKGSSAIPSYQAPEVSAPIHSSLRSGGAASSLNTTYSSPEMSSAVAQLRHRTTTVTARRRTLFSSPH